MQHFNHPPLHATLPAPSSTSTSPSASTSTPASSVEQVHSIVLQSSPALPLEETVERQKRRRTSPQDQVILEAAFNHNSKPDKASRIDIASKVSLGDKEISIWFQNKRQVTRRRSRPVIMSEESTAEIVGSQGLPSTASCCHGFLVPKLKLAKSSGKKGRDTSFVVFDECHAEGPNFETSVLAVITDTPTLPASLKRAVSQPRLHTSLDGSVRIKTGDSPSPLPPRPHTDNPIRQPRASGPLQRSQSAFVPPTFGKTRSAAAPGRSRDSRTWAFYCDSEARDELTKQAEREQSGSAVGAIGLIRSRSKGSLAAGTLINATNNKRPSPSIDAKKPANQKRLKAEDISAKASDANLGSKKTKAQISALAKRKANPLSAATMTHPFINQINKDPRLRSTNDRPKTEKKKALTEFETEVDGNESDKENWAPGTQIVVSPVRRQMHRPANMPSARVLRDNSSIPSTSNSLGTMLGRSATSTPTLGKGKGMTAGKRNRLATKKDEKEKPAKQGPEIKDVENMANEKGKEEAPAEEEDLSCVQGLLSLSQGEWR